MTEPNDESVQIIHLRLCQRATDLGSAIAALEEAAEEIAALQAENRTLIEAKGDDT